MDTTGAYVHGSVCFIMSALSPTAAMIQALCWTLCKHHPLNQTRRVLSTVLVIVDSWGDWEVSNITGVTRKWWRWICNPDIKPIIVSWWQRWASAALQVLAYPHEFYTSLPQGRAAVSQKPHLTRWKGRRKRVTFYPRFSRPTLPRYSLLGLSFLL